MRFLVLLMPWLLMATSEITLFDSQTLTPIEGARIISENSVRYTDGNGTVRLDEPVDAVRVLAHGYRPLSARLESDTTLSTLMVEPIRVKALYLSFWGASSGSERLDEIIRLCKETEINAVVIDIKNEFGLTSYKTSVADARAIGAHRSRTIRDIDAFVSRLKAEGIYTIGRIVVFKDILRADAMPDMAIKNADGSVWHNKEGMAWLDPFIEANRRYNIDIAADAARSGFDEINFDYIRFPAVNDIRLGAANDAEARIRTIQSFLKEARERLEPLGVFISADTFGQVSWDKSDTGIGQTVASLAQYADYLSPMLYPSGFSRGWMGLEDPTSDVYTIVYESLKRLDIDPRRVRPWLQAFKDYAHSRTHFKADRIRGQINAAEQYGSGGWLLWNPRSRYRKEGLKTEEKVDYDRAALYDTGDDSGYYSN